MCGCSKDCNLPQAAGGGFGLTGKCFLDRCIPDAAAGIQVPVPSCRAKGSHAKSIVDLKSFFRKSQRMSKVFVEYH